MKKTNKKGNRFWVTKWFIGCSISVVFCFVSLNVLSQSLVATNLNCENQVKPIGVDTRSPQLSWQLHCDERNILQTAYRILVSDNDQSLKDEIGNLWDTKKVNSAACNHIRYAGKKLKPDKTYYWKVMIWDNKNHVSNWSRIAMWHTGLLEEKAWKNAKWIAYDTLPDSLRIVPGEPGKGNKKRPDLNDVLPVFRKEFSIKKQIKTATACISGVGQFEMYLNGKKVGNHFLDPTWTNYDKEAKYITFDITQQLTQGKNAVGVMLGNGFYFMPRDKRYRKLTNAYGYPKMICVISIKYADGTEENVASDSSWKSQAGPVTYSSIYGGEDYNANLEQPGWDQSTFNDKTWKRAISTSGPQLRSQTSGHIDVKEIFTPEKVNKINDSTVVYDLGQNASGIPEIAVRGKKGDTVRIFPAELLKDNGTVNQRATGSPHYDTYVLKGEGVETWHPRFTYYGFRYLQIENVSLPSSANEHRLPVIISAKGLHIRNNARRMGTFECSNELFNRTFALIDWAIKSNLSNVLTDCPHREKLGWLEQTHLMGNSIQYNFDVANYFRKTVRDMMEAQTSDGLIPEIAPEYVLFDFGNGMFRNSPEWGSAAILLPWYLYQWYGDEEILHESYPMMKKYIGYLKSKATDNIISQGLGDWYDLGPEPPGVSQLTPMGITATAIYYYDLITAAKVAKLVGNGIDAKTFEALAAQVRKSFNNKFFNKETKEYGAGSQTANAMAVYMGLVEPQYKNDVVENIIKSIREHNNSLTAGDIGYRYLLKVLDYAGRSDVIFEMNNRSDVPGYGYQLAKGATSLTESWQALPTVSNNHLMLGHLMEWFYAGLAGIRQNEDSVGYKHIIIRPEPVGDIMFVKASYESIYGPILSSWEKDKNVFKLNVAIPPNTTANVYLPADSSSLIEEGNSSIRDRYHIKFENGKAVIAIGSGSYSFVVKQ